MANLQDVAEHAGVSITTVSRVVNNPTRVSPKTRRRVQKSIETLEYRPNRVAQRLRWDTGQAKMFGVIIPELNNTFFSNVVRGIEDVAYAENYAVILCNADGDPEREAFYLDVLRAESADGVIMAPNFRDGNTSARLKSFELPIVCFDQRPDAITFDTVIVDNEAGAHAAVDHLIRLGHERIAGVFASQKNTASRARLQGFRTAMSDHGIDVDESMIRTDALDLDGSREKTLELFSAHDRPTALFTHNNVVTLGAMEALNERGLSVPSDVAIVGFDDVPWAQLVSLSTVRQPSYEMGRRSAELLIRRIMDPRREPVLTVMQPKLIVRGSCGGRA